MGKFIKHLANERGYLIPRISKNLSTVLTKIISIFQLQCSMPCKKKNKANMSKCKGNWICFISLCLFEWKTKHCKQKLKVRSQFWQYFHQ
jgi:hypothetical protein